MESEETLGPQFSVHCQPVLQSLESDFLSLERVIDFMINTLTQIPSAEVAGVVGPAPPLPETIVAAPGPDFVWVGDAWLWFGDSRV
jgi:hypothetical protein